jgi:hypothetical protein
MSSAQAVAVNGPERILFSFSNFGRRKHCAASVVKREIATWMSGVEDRDLSVENRPHYSLCCAWMKGRSRGGAERGRIGHENHDG